MRRAFAVSVFAVHEGKVLLIRHKRLGLLLPIGGEVEANETPLDAAKRELKEETGFEGDFDLPPRDGVPGTPHALIAYEEHPAGSKGDHLCFAFACRAPTREVVSDESFDAFVWVAPEEIVHSELAPAPENVVACARRAVALVDAAH